MSLSLVDRSLSGHILLEKWWCAMTPTVMVQRFLFLGYPIKNKIFRIIKIILSLLFISFTLLCPH